MGELARWLPVGKDRPSLGLYGRVCARARRRANLPMHRLSQRQLDNRMLSI